VRIFAAPQELLAVVGEHLGTSDWLVVDQDRITRFAGATGDAQWIHVDPDRAATGPFGGTIAHGFLILSLVPVLTSGVYRVDGAGMAVNYGLNRVRFTAPVRSGSAIRAAVRVLHAERVTGGVQVHNEVTVELRDSAKPSCVAETLTRWYEGGV
jgi:acyl dehydratase